MFCLCSLQVQHFKEFIPKAFPNGCDLILDSEVLLIDTKTSKPLPFGTLGVHKVRNHLFMGFVWHFVFSGRQPDRQANKQRTTCNRQAIG